MVHFKFKTSNHRHNMTYIFITLSYTYSTADYIIPQVKEKVIKKSTSLSPEPLNITNNYIVKQYLHHKYQTLIGSYTYELL